MSRTGVHRVFAQLWLLLCISLAALAGAGAAASEKAAEAAPPAPVLAPIEAHPALWMVRSGHAVLYLFGSIHLLPPNVDWHSPPVEKAIKASDVFVFEAP